MKFTVERNWVDVVGKIWQPGVGLCAQTRSLTAHDMESIGEPTRENVSSWVDSHFGDFSSIKDFHAVIGEAVLDWHDEENESIFNDCMFPQE